MKKVTLKILAEDIRNNNYIDSATCPITRALVRAGINARHAGWSIRYNENKSPQSVDRSIDNRIHSMYATKLGTSGVSTIPIEDYELEVEIPDNWLTTNK